MDCHPSNNEDNEMTIASDLLQQHIQTLVDDNARWQTLIADNILWELAYAPSLGHPAQLSGREEAVRHATWFVGAVGNAGHERSEARGSAPQNKIACAFHCPGDQDVEAEPKRNQRHPARDLLDARELLKRKSPLHVPCVLWPSADLDLIRWFVVLRVGCRGTQLA